MDPTDATAVRPKLRWYQFSLRTLLIVTAVLGLGLGWLGREFNRARRQKAAVSALSKLGAEVQYDYQRDAPRGAQPQPPGPQWVNNLLGDDFLADVVAVSIEGPGMGGNAEITDAEMVHFEALPRLEQLRLEDQPKVTDVGVAHVSRLSRLETLVLGGTSLTSAGLVHLKRLRNLKQLDLFGTKIDDGGLLDLIGLKALRHLDVSGRRITDAGLVHLGKMTQLDSLALDHAKITDAGLVHLRGLANLKELSLRNTQVTDEGVEKLQRTLPNCRVFRGPIAY